MRIAYFTLPVDNNYGGHLQRYALMSAVNRMGHEVTHINLFPNRGESAYASRRRQAKFAVLRILTDLRIHEQSGCLPFYNRYVRHTREYTSDALCGMANEYDACLVGSDQVWRPSMARTLLPSYFFNFLPTDYPGKRIAYGVSFGEDKCIMDEANRKMLGELYGRLDAVSVREDAGLQILKALNWTMPEASRVIDPTCLIEREQYENLIAKGHTHPFAGKMYCYILDRNVLTDTIIAEEAVRHGLTPVIVSYKDKKSISVEQWLRGFADAEYVVTDSYHGLVFSLIFNKPVRVLGNTSRGNARFDSLFRIFQIEANTNLFDWSRINAIMEAERKQGIGFLMRALSL